MLAVNDSTAGGMFPPTIEEEEPNGEAELPASTEAQVPSLEDKKTDTTDWRDVRLQSGGEMDNLAHPSTRYAKRDAIVDQTRTTPPPASRVPKQLLRLSETVASYLMLSRSSPEALRAMSSRAKMNFFLSEPEETVVGWRLQQLIMLVLFINVAVMASETLDGPRFRSSDPAFPYMLQDSTYSAIETLFTVFYVIEFAVRWISAPSQLVFWKSIPSWIALLATIAAVPKLAGVVVGAEDSRQIDTFTYILRIFRAVRLIVLAYAYVGTKVLFRAVTHSIAPLKITLFFLITVVMVFATAIFYAEPCYDLQTCTFTDIFNSAYFIMITVATVGYGGQVPSITNPGSIIVTCIVMIFGTLYLSMPLAIIGIKYELAWREHDEFAKLALRSRSLREIAAQVATEQLKSAANSGNIDETIEKLEVYSVSSASSATCERFYELSQEIVDVHSALGPFVSPGTSEADQPTTLEGVLQYTKQRSDEASQALDGIMSVIKLHRRVCADTHALLLSQNTSSQQEAGSTRRLSSRFLSVVNGRIGSKTLSSDSSGSKLRRAQGTLASIGSRAVKAMTERVQHQDSTSARAVIWNIFEHRRDIWLARVVNRVRLYLVVFSIAMFYLQTTPELQETGLRTVLCQRTVRDFCRIYNNQEDGCHVFQKVTSSAVNTSVVVSDDLVNFHCSIGDPDGNCYASGVNFGSEDFPLECKAVFGSKNGAKVCRNRLCQPSRDLVLNMEPYWVYLEFFFGIIFTIEFTLRVYAHPARRQLWGSFSAIVDAIILLPFYVEAVEIAMGEMPTYSVVPTIPSFFSAIRILKTLRILKLGTHIPGARVLTKTAQIIWRRLVIPLFFLFMGCIVSAAIFFELERGTECFIGNSCTWWGKDVLTPELSAGLPVGKRVLVQNTQFAIITDMMRSTWFSLVSFTTVGYGDMYPRTSLGKLFDVIGTIFSSCYTAMPLTLVGGQFYICYEVYAREEKKRKIAERKPVKPQEDFSTTIIASRLRTFTNLPPEDGNASHRDISRPGLEEEAPTSIASVIGAEVQSPSPPSMSLTSPRTRSKQVYAQGEEGDRAPELKIINQFFLMHKVFNAMIEDLSDINRLGAEFVTTARKRSPVIGDGTEVATVFADIRRREEEVEAKISQNLAFCMTAFLNFTPIIDHILRTKRWTSLLPPVAHTEGLLSTAGPKSELLHTNNFHWSDGQGKIDSDGEAHANSDRGFSGEENLSKTDDNS